jgi:hypothetical protein
MPIGPSGAKENCCKLRRATYVAQICIIARYRREQAISSDVEVPPTAHERRGVRRRSRALDGTQETEDAIAEVTKATIGCRPFPPSDPAGAESGVRVCSGKPSERRVVFAKAY